MKMKPEMKYILNNKGFTLVELMVIVVLIGIVLSIVYNMMTTGNRIFAQGDAKADVQSSLRVSGDFISDKLRYASDVKILDALPADFTAGTKEYIYEEDGRLKYYDGYTISDVPGVLDGVQTGIYFEDRNSEAVLIRLNATFREQVYEVETATSLLNIGDSILISASGPVVEFIPGIPVNANINARPVESIDIRTEPEGITESPVGGHVAFVAEVSPSDASQKTVRWEIENSDDVDFATIESTSATTGLLKFNDAAVAGDSVTVKAHAMDGSGVESEFPITITVNEEAPVVPGVTVTVYSIYDRIFNKNGVLQMEAVVTPSGATTLGVEWDVNVDNSIATISETGGELKTIDTSYRGPITVTATLPTGEWGSKTIQVIDSFQNIIVEKVSSSGNQHTVRCILDPTNKPATLVNGIVSIEWEVKVTAGNGTTTEAQNDSNGTIVITTHDNVNKFTVKAKVTPISGSGKENIIEIKP